MCGSNKKSCIKSISKGFTVGKNSDGRSRLSVPPQYRKAVEREMRKAYGDTSRPDELLRMGKLFSDLAMEAKELGMKENSFLRALYTENWKRALLIAVENYYESDSPEQIERVFIEMYIAKGGSRTQEKIINWVDEASNLSMKVIWEFQGSEEIAQSVKRALVLGMGNAADALDKKAELKHL